MPARPMPRAFPMTAMADMLFQLLIFFMLTANLTPFAMLDFRTGQLSGRADSATEGSTPAEPAMDARRTAIWTLGTTGLVSGGQHFALDQLPALADALADLGTPHLLIVLRPDVPVRDVILVLEALQLRGITAVQIADGGSTG
ncbi:MAG: biopolymer transporter ExbD [Paracoccus sp. (in: a-proteobacteria)]|uniref:ExbD/TolR family protein n=1 Tax=Paracoccus sp. TaxID=267 RepID=UPI0026E0D8AA|nr:biopolymer transporter ExbD [Paracoccus sp. (in: a-proteobacteria)]MDO5622832.1 biopolymer transporter ExbD [Paracoccus sp. (in: a-proteobacteria)]